MKYHTSLLLAYCVQCVCTLLHQHVFQEVILDCGAQVLCVCTLRIEKSKLSQPLFFVAVAMMGSGIANSTLSLSLSLSLRLMPEVMREFGALLIKNEGKSMHDFVENVSTYCQY